MAYEPTTWQTGDIVTAEKLNKLENGVTNASSGCGGGNLVATATYNETAQIYSLDKSWKEIKDAFDAKKIVMVYDGSTSTEHEGATLANVWYLSTISSASSDETTTYGVIFWDINGYRYVFSSTDQNEPMEEGEFEPTPETGE